MTHHGWLMSEKKGISHPFLKRGTNTLNSSERRKHKKEAEKTVLTKSDRWGGA